MNILKYIDLKVVVIIGLIIAILCLMRHGINHDRKIVYVGGKPYEVIKHTVDTIYVPTKPFIRKVR